jgi:hypothetical protein
MVSTLAMELWRLDNKCDGIQCICARRYKTAVTTMRSNAKRVEVAARQPRPVYRTIEGWALGTLLEEHAVGECADHGHMRNRTDADSWNRAREANEYDRVNAAVSRASDCDGCMRSRARPD